MRRASRSVATERYRIRAYELVQMLGEITKGRHVEWFRRSRRRNRKCCHKARIINTLASSGTKYELFKRELATISACHRRFNDKTLSTPSSYKHGKRSTHTERANRPVVKTCPGEHGTLKVTRIPRDMKITCDVCSRPQEVGTHACSCRECNFDVCLECFYGRKMIVIGNKREHKTHIRNLTTLRPPPRPPKVSEHLFAFAKRAIRAQRTRSWRIVGLEKKEKVVNVDGKRYVEIRDCVECNFDISGTTTKLIVTNCRHCTFRTTDARPLCVTSQATVALSRNVVFDLRTAPRSQISVFTIEQSDNCTIRVRKMRRGRLYTDSTRNTILVVGNVSHHVRSQRSDEREYLITHIKSNGDIVTERGVRRGLVLMPLSESRDGG